MADLDASTTVWLLDVDGVLNALDPGWGAAPRKAHAFSSAVRRGFTVRWAPALIARIREVHRAGLVEIRWCTTWCGDTDEIEKVLSLPHFEPCWTDYVNGFDCSAEKLAAAREVLADGHRLIWTDDDEVPESGPLHEELTADGRALLIRPNPRRGLQPEHMDAIEAFANRGGLVGACDV